VREPLLSKLIDPARQLGRMDKRGRLLGAAVCTAVLLLFLWWDHSAAVAGRPYVVSALQAEGHPGAKVRRAYLVGCGKGGIGFVWTSGRARGVACTSKLAPDRVSIDQRLVAPRR
jgi:hypothetical protein